VVTGKREKGIDVLCALAVVRQAADPGTDLVILASTDTDLLPAIEEARDLGIAKIETASWYHPAHPPHERGFELRLGRGHRSHWNTRLTEPDFIATTSPGIEPQRARAPVADRSPTGLAGAGCGNLVPGEPES
jgi:hypothetical protein